VSPAVEGRLQRFFDTSFLHIARNSTWSVATTFVVAGAVFAETIVLARYLGTDDYGVYLLVLALPEAIQLFLDFRTREAMTRYLGRFLAREEGDRAVAVTKLLWLVDLAVVLSAFVIVFAIAPYVAPRLTNDPDATTLMRIYAIAMLLGGLDATAGAVIRVFDRFRLAFVAGAGSILMRLAIMIGLVVGGAGLEGLVWGRVAAEIIATLLIGLIALSLLKRALWSHRRAPISALAGMRGEILRFLGHMNVQGSIRAAATKLDVVCVGAIAGPSAASLYKIGVQFGASPILFADPLFASVYPTFSRLGALGRVSEIRSMGRKASTVLAVLAIPVAVVLAVESEAILTFLLGEAFADAWAPMTIILIGVLPSVLFFWGRAAMLVRGDARRATAIVTTATIVQFALLLALTPSYGATGAAVGYAAMSVVVAAMTVWYLRRNELV
jgi:O-antigen/teichoic acid export membrane protein